MDRTSSSTCIMHEGIVGRIKRESRVRKRDSNIRRKKRQRKARRRRERADFPDTGRRRLIGACIQSIGFVVKSRSQGRYSYSLITMFFIILARSPSISG